MFKHQERSITSVVANLVNLSTTKISIFIDNKQCSNNNYD